MPTALYYPHTRLENQSLLKTALVLFDKVEWIAPDEVFQPKYQIPQAKEAMEVIGERYIPSTEEQDLVHKEVERLVAKPLPEWFVFEPENQDLASQARHPYEILPGKFLDKTWRLLQKKAGFVTRANLPAPEYKSCHYPNFDKIL
jgi:hypothetical protein